MDGVHHPRWSSPHRLRRQWPAAAIRVVGLLLSMIPVFGSAAADQGQVCAPQTADELLPTLVGAPTVRALSNGGSDSYRIELRAGDLVTITVGPHGIDVGARLLAPDGTTLADVSHRQSGERVLSAIPRTSGIHHLEIRALETSSVSGCYAVSIRELHVSEPRDSARLQARRTFVRGEALWAEARRDAASKALVQFQRASALWKVAADDSGQALACRKLGTALHALGRPDEALKPLLESLELARRAGETESEAAALNSLARVYLDLGRMEDASTHAERALAVSRANQIQSREAEGLNVLGDIYSFSGRFAESLDAYVKALDLSKALSDREGEAAAMLNKGYAEVDLGRVGDAQASYERALSLWAVLGDPRGQAATLTALGHLHVVVGENERALGRYRQASALAEPLGDLIGRARIQAGLGAVHRNLGEAAPAIAYYRKSAELFRAAKYPNGEATARLWLGASLSALGQQPRAIQELTKVLALARSLSDKRLEAQALESLGRAHLELGERQLALQRYRESRKLAGDIGDRKWEIYSLNGIAMTLHRLGDHQQALTNLMEAQQIGEQLKSRFASSLTLFNLARVESALDRLDQAVTDIQASLELAETLRSDVASLDLRASYVASVRDRHELEIELLMRLNERRPGAKYDALAFEASERARARSFLDGLAETRSSITEGVTPELLERERSIRNALNAKAQQLTRVQGVTEKADEASALGREIDLMTTTHHEVEAQIRAVNPRYAGLTQPKPLTLREVQTLVVDDKSVLLLQYFLGKNRSYVWAVTSEEIQGFMLPGRNEIERRVRSYREALTAPASAPLSGQGLSSEGLAQARALGRILLGPVAGYLSRSRVLIVADGVLHLLPFAALPDPRTLAPPTPTTLPLIARHEVVNLPSASTLALVRGTWNQERRWSKTARIFADPVFEADDPRIRNGKPVTTAGVHSGQSRSTTVESLKRALRDVGGPGTTAVPRLLETRREARDIAKLVPRVDVALDFDANRASAMSPTLAGYQVIHFATHGLIDNDHPELSGIILSLYNEKGQAQNGFLRLQDIYNLNLPVDLVVLSACSTALGKEVVGEGLIGLVRGFMYAGGRRVLASLWKVDDEATSELMTEFYRAMFKRGLTPPAALQAAQIELRKSERWAHPYYWAGFVLQGEWK
jgi:CHAT domain-containing protein/tetratricopeptide (TPR) repeat protein